MIQESESYRQNLYMRIGVMKDLKTKAEESIRLAYTLRWDPWYQGDRAPLPWNPGTRAFFYFFIFIFLAGVNFFGQKNGKKLCFLSVFSLFLSLFLSFSVHTVWVLFSVIHFTKVSCEG